MQSVGDVDKVIIDNGYCITNRLLNLELKHNTEILPKLPMWKQRFLHLKKMGITLEKNIIIIKVGP